MASKKPSTGIDPTLTKAIDSLVKKVTLDKMEPVLDSDGNPKKDAQGKVVKRPMYSLTDVVKVLDRKLKLEQMRLDVKDQGFGSGFTDDEDENDGPESKGD